MLPSHCPAFELSRHHTPTECLFSSSDSKAPIYPGTQQYSLRLEGEFSPLFVNSNFLLTKTSFEKKYIYFFKFQRPLKVLRKTTTSSRVVLTRPDISCVRISSLKIVYLFINTFIFNYDFYLLLRIACVKKDCIILSRVAWLCSKCHTLRSALSLGTPYPCNLIVILN